MRGDEMKLIYLTTGRIIAAVYNKDWFMFDNQGASTGTFVIDEIDPDNKFVCLDIVRSQGKEDEDGDPKYMVTEGELVEKENWVEKVNEFVL